MNSRTCLRALFLLTWISLGAARGWAADPALVGWKAASKHAVALVEDRHVIHSYFNTCPESPDGKYVLYYTSGTREGELGDLRILERASGQEKIIASGIHTEDAHRAACQQWSNGGKTVVYHDCRDERWRVVAIDIASGKETVLAQDRQLGFGSATGVWAPIYGCHWKPGPYRDLELANVQTGEMRTVVTAEAAAKEYAEFIQTKFGTTDISVFFPVMSPDETKVFFKLNHPSGGDDFRSMKSSEREGKVVYDLKANKFIRLIGKWGHPSWSGDSTGIFELGNYLLNVETGKSLPRYAPSCFTNHPSLSPDGRLFVTDGDTSKQSYGKPAHWGVAVGSTKEDEFALLDLFDNSKGATSWRHNHPHPVFSADGRRVYYNVNDGPWTRLMVAEVGGG